MAKVSTVNVHGDSVYLTADDFTVIDQGAFLTINVGPVALFVEDPYQLTMIAVTLLTEQERIVRDRQQVVGDGSGEALPPLDDDAYPAGAVEVAS